MNALRDPTARPPLMESWTQLLGLYFGSTYFPIYEFKFELIAPRTCRENFVYVACFSRLVLMHVENNTRMFSPVLTRLRSGTRLLGLH